MKHSKKIWQIYAYSTVMPMVIMGVVFILALLQVGDRSFFSGDIFHQYFPIYRSLSRAVVSFDFLELFYSFNKSLGGEMASVYGFNSISPFTLLYTILPFDQYHLSLIIVTLLRYGAFGASFAYLLIQRYDAKHKPIGMTVLFSVTYTLSGYMVANQINPNFLDNLVYLPIILVHLERLLDGKQAKWLPIWIAVIYVTQFYIAYMMTLFLMIYPIWYLSREGRTISEVVRVYRRLIVAVVWGLLMCAVWLISVVSLLLFSKASKYGFHLNWTRIGYDPLTILLKLVPGTIHWQEWSQTTGALPNIHVATIVMYYVFSFFGDKAIVKREKIGAIITLGVIVLSFVYEPLFRLWHMGQLPMGFSQRFAFVMVLLLLVIGYRSVGDAIILKPWAISVYGGLIVVAFYLAKIPIVSMWYLLGFVVFISLIGIMLWHRQRLSTYGQLAILGLTAVELSVSGYFATTNVLGSVGHLVEYRQQSQAVSDAVEAADTGFYRTVLSRVYFNDGMEFSAKGLSHFSSSLETNTQTFMKKLGITTSPAIIDYRHSTAFHDVFFGVKYFSMYESTPSVVTLASPKTLTPTVKVYQNDLAFSVGFLAPTSLQQVNMNQNPIAIQNAIMRALETHQEPPVQFEEVPLRLSGENAVTTVNQENNVLRFPDKNKDSWIVHTLEPSEDYFYYLKLPKDVISNSQHVTVLYNDQKLPYSTRAEGDLVIPLPMSQQKKPKIEVKVATSRTFETLDALRVYRLPIAPFKQFAQSQQDRQLQVTAHTSHSIEGTIAVAEDKQLLVFTIPYHTGWEVLVDGQKVQPLRVLEHLIGVPVTKGKHNVSLAFKPIGLWIGLGVSTSAILTWVIRYYVKKERK